VLWWRFTQQPLVEEVEAEAPSEAEDQEEETDRAAPAEGMEEEALVPGEPTVFDTDQEAEDSEIADLEPANPA
jgi:hypothetical protein